MFDYWLCEMDDFTINNHSIKLFVLVLLMAQVTMTPGLGEILLNSTDHDEECLRQSWKPIGPTEYRTIEEATATAYNERRRLSPFQLCLLCKCCSASNCATLPCCFGIDCQLPNKPFGVCAFVPKSCNCTSCATA